MLTNDTTTGASNYDAGTTLFWHPTGPLINYNGSRLLVANLNPEVEIKWAMTRWEMFKLGWRCIRAALST